MTLRCFQYAVAEYAAELVHLVVDCSVVLCQFRDHALHRSRDETVAVVGAGEDATAIRKHIYNLLLATECSAGNAAADGLCKGCHIGDDAERFLRAAESHVESREGFVEDQQDAVIIAELTDTLLIFRFCNAAADVQTHRLHDDAGDIVIRFEEGFHLLQIIEVQKIRIVQRVLRTAACKAGMGIVIIFIIAVDGMKICAAGIRSAKNEICSAMVHTLETNDHVLSRVRTRNAKRIENVFAARDGEAHPIRTGNIFAEEFGGFHLNLCVLTGVTIVNLIFQRLLQDRIGLSHEAGAGGQGPVDVHVAVDIIEMAAVHALKEGLYIAGMLFEVGQMSSCDGVLRAGIRFSAFFVSYGVASL